MDWPGGNPTDQSTWPKPPKTYWVRADLKDIPSNKFTEMCANHAKLHDVIKSIESAKVQQCFTTTLCDTCNNYIEGRTLNSEPVINIFEGIKAQSIRDICFNENLSEKLQIFNPGCFKMIPTIFRGQKQSHKYFEITKDLLGNLNMDTVYQQLIDRQRIWFTQLEDNWTNKDDNARKQEDNENFLKMLIKLLVNDDMGTFSSLQFLRKD